MKDWLNTFEYLGSHSANGQIISSWQKVFPNEYRICYHTYENEYGGKSIIAVDVLPEIGESEGIYHKRSPSLSFFATGFEEFEELENKIKREIVPTLKKWAIKTL
jgi:hypothetical protein